MAEVVFSGPIGDAANNMQGPISASMQPGTFASPDADETEASPEQGAMGQQDTGDMITGPAQVGGVAAQPGQM